MMASVTTLPIGGVSMVPFAFSDSDKMLHLAL